MATMQTAVEYNVTNCLHRWGQAHLDHRDLDGQWLPAQDTELRIRQRVSRLLEFRYDGAKRDPWKARASTRQAGLGLPLEAPLVQRLPLAQMRQLPSSTGLPRNPPSRWLRFPRNS